MKPGTHVGPVDTGRAVPVDRPVTDVLLRDGRIAHLRPAVATDGPGLRRLHAGLSLRTRLLRYSSVSERTGDAYVDSVVAGAPDTRSLVAEIAGQVVAVGSFFGLGASSRTAEVALLIGDEHQAKGLGTLLLEHLAAAAWQQGITTFAAEVRPDNTAMLDLFTRSGLAVAVQPVSGGASTLLTLEPAEHLWDVVQARESAAVRASLLAALAPRSLAVVGGSRPDSMAQQVLGSIARGGFTGQVHEVGRHPVPFDGVVAGTGGRAGRLASACAGHLRVGDIGSPVDLVVVAVPAAQVLEVAADSAAAGARALVVLSAGFAEAGPAGRDRQHRLLALCRDHDMRLIGPSSLGIVNTDPLVRLDATSCDARPLPGSIALVAQSAVVGIAALRHAESTGVGLSLFVSTGDKADVSGNDLLSYLESDPATSVIGLYLESFGNARTFARVAARVGRTKPIVAVKADRSGAARRAAGSGSAAAAAADVAVDALFAQAGVLRADSLPELLDIATVLDTGPRPAGGRVVVVGNGGGSGVLAADACTAAHLDVAPLSRGTRDALRRLVPAALAVENPVDVRATATAEEYGRAVSLVLADPDVDAVLAVCTPLSRDGEAPFAAALRRCAADAPTTTLLACFPGVRTPPPALRGHDGRLAVPCFEFGEPAARALGRVVAHSRWHRRPFAVPAVLTDVDRPAARELVEDALAAAGDGWVGAVTAAAILTCYGIATAASETATQPAAAAGGTAGIAGIAGTVDTVELVAGVVVDDTMGPLVLVGAGGVFGDVLDDQAVHLLPLDEARARELVLSLRCAPMLTGAHGRPPVDLTAVTETLLRLAALAADLPEVAELVLDPLLAGPVGVRAAGVRIRLAARAPEPALPVRGLRGLA